MLLLDDWSRAYQLSLNMTKTVSMLFWAKGKKLDIRVNNINMVTSTKFLGLQIDHELSWKEHCMSVYNKLSVHNHFLSMAKHMLDIKSLLSIYYAHVYSHLIHGLNIWGNMATNSDLDIIYKMQKACVRSVCSARKMHILLNSLSV